MSCKNFMLAVIFSLMITGIASAASGPAGFVNVPWEASRDQVAQEMAAQGFSFKRGGNPASKDFVWATYQGALAGISGELSFGFLNGAFCDGVFHFNGSGDDIAEQISYWKIQGFIQSQYGPSTESSKDFLLLRFFNTWKGLQAPGTSDEIFIDMTYSPRSNSNGPLEVTYTNPGLRQRLKKSASVSCEAINNLVDREMASRVFYSAACSPTLSGILNHANAKSTADGIFLAESNGFLYFVPADSPVPAFGEKFKINMVAGRNGLASVSALRLQAGLTLEKFQDLQYISCEVVILPGKQVVIKSETYVDKRGETIVAWKGSDWSAFEPPAEFIAKQCREFLIDWLTLQ